MPFKFPFICSSKANFEKFDNPNTEQQPRHQEDRHKRKPRKSVDRPNQLGAGLDRLVDRIVHRVEDVDNPDGDLTQRDLHGFDRRRHNTRCLDRFWTEQSDYTERHAAKRANTYNTSKPTSRMTSLASNMTLATDYSNHSMESHKHHHPFSPQSLRFEDDWSRLSCVLSPRRKDQKKISLV